MLKFDWNMLWTVLNLILFYFLMRKFLFKPIKNVMEKRQNMIDEQYEKAESANKLASEKLSDYESKLANAEAEGEKIKAEARSSAKDEYNKIMDRASADAKALRVDAEKQIELDTEAAKKAAREEIASLAMQAAEKVVASASCAETDSEIFDEFLKGSEN